mmetsp:Transcript_20328/g.49921  ORF Transcript_20328/g.49921 Transcript_20328/m.49921 type:complete len:241 (+) Transcript_20328:596-1318(+)
MVPRRRLEHGRALAPSLSSGQLVQDLLYDHSSKRCPSSREEQSRRGGLEGHSRQHLCNERHAFPEDLDAGTYHEASDEKRANCFEFPEAVWKDLVARPPRQLDADEGDEVADNVRERVQRVGQESRRLCKRPNHRFENREDDVAVNPEPDNSSGRGHVFVVPSRHNLLGVMVVIVIMDYELLHDASDLPKDPAYAFRVRLAFGLTRERRAPRGSHGGSPAVATVFERRGRCRRRQPRWYW